MKISTLAKLVRYSKHRGAWNPQSLFSFSFASLNRVPVPDFQDDGTSYADQAAYDASWISSDTAVVRGNPTTDLIDFVIASDATDNRISKDMLGVAISDTAWILRFSVRAPVSSTGAEVSIVITDQASGVASDTASHDFIGIKIENISFDNIYGIDGDGISMNEAANDHTLVITIGATIRYLEIVRTSATTYTVKVFSDADYTTQVGSTGNGTTVSTVDGLRYIRMFERIKNNATVATLEFDNFKFWNNRSSL